MWTNSVCVYIVPHPLRDRCIAWISNQKFGIKLFVVCLVVVCCLYPSYQTKISNQTHPQLKDQSNHQLIVQGTAHDILKQPRQEQHHSHFHADERGGEGHPQVQLADTKGPFWSMFGNQFPLNQYGTSMLFGSVPNSGKTHQKKKHGFPSLFGSNCWKKKKETRCVFLLRTRKPRLL